MRKSNYRLRVGAVVSAALALVLAACGGGSAADDDEDSGGDGEVSGDITLLTPIYEGTDGQRLLEDELLPEFYEQYPEVSVEVDYATYGTLNEKLTTAVASGLIPDVMMMGVGWIEGFADRGVLADLEPLGISREDMEQSYTPQIVDAGTLDDALYAVPIMLDTRFAVARMDLLQEAGYDEPPSTWAELHDYAVALTKRAADGTLEQAGFDLLSMDLRQMFLVFLFSSGASLFDEGVTEPTFNSPEAVAALQFLVDLVNEDKVEDIGYSSTDAEVNPVVNGRAAMGMAHNNLWLQIQESAPDIADQFVPFLIEDAEPGMFFGGTLATVSARSEHPEAAAALVEFLSSPDAALAANEQRGNVPALTELLDSDYVQGNPFVQFAMENLDSAQREGGPPQWLEIRGEFTPAIEAALLGQKSPQQALDDLAQNARDAMAR